MALAFRAPGVYLEESPFNNPPTDIGGSQSQAVFVGASSKGPINQAVAIQSWSDYVARFGGFNKIANVSGGPLARNNIFVSRNQTSLNSIVGPRLGDVAFVNEYRFSKERFYLHNTDGFDNDAPGYSDPHQIWIYCGAALLWQNTGFNFHTENGFFGVSGQAYSANGATFGNGDNVIRGDSNYTCNFYMSNGIDDTQSFTGSSPTALDLGMHWNTTDDRWSLWMYGTDKYWFESTGGSKGTFQNSTGTTFEVFPSGAAWQKIDLPFQNAIQTSAAPPGADWSLFTSINSSNTPLPIEQYIPLDDMPDQDVGQQTIFAGINWTGWSPDLIGASNNTVTALPYLPYAVNSFFQNGGRNAWIIRAVSTTEAGLASSVDYTHDVQGGGATAFTVQAVGAGTWGDSLAVNMALVTEDQGQMIFSVRVLLDGTEVERFPNCTMTGTLPGTKRLDQAVNDPSLGSRYIVIVDFDDQVQPTLDSANTPRELSGGSDPNLPSASDLTSSAADTVTSIDGSLLVNIVGHTTNQTDPSAFVYPTAVSSTQIVGNSGRTNIFVVNDACPPRPSQKPSQDYISQEIQSTLISSSSVDSYVAAYAPWIVVPDPAVPGGTISTPPGGAIIGVYARTDSTVGVFQTPAGVTTGAITNALGVDTKFTDSQLGELNHNNINIIRSVQGSGMCIMGARTRKKYGVDQYIAPRRTLIYIEETLTAATQFAVFQNNDQRLWAKLSMTADRILRPLWTAGGLAGNSTAEAYYIKCDGTVNTPSVVASGEVRLEIGVALEYPAEFVVITVSQFDGTTFTTEVQPT